MNARTALSPMSSIRSAGVLALACSLIGGAFPAACRAQDRPANPRNAVAVMPFHLGRDVEAWRASNAFTEHLHTTLSEALVGRGHYVVERDAEAGQGIENEELLREYGRVGGDPSPAGGQGVQARRLIFGTVTAFTVRTEDSGGIPVPFVGSFSNRKTEATVTLTARIVDLNTRQIIASAKGEGRESNSRFSIGGGGFLGWLGRVQVGSADWNRSPIGKAAEKAMAHLSQHVAEKLAALPDGGEPATPGIESVRPSVPTNSPIASPSSPAPQPLAESGSKPRVVVLIPERHLASPIPDPAAETEMIHRLVDAGFDVRDDKRLHELAKETWVQEAIHGNIDAGKLRELKQRFGAEILIIGEGISQRAPALPGVSSTAVYCRARVEARAILMETAQILAADGVQTTGRDLTEALAAKRALQTAGGELFEKIAGRLTVNAQTVASRLTLEIRGWKAHSDALDFIDALKGCPGVNDVKKREFRGGILFLEVEIPGAEDKLTRLLERNPSLRDFRLTVDSASSAKIEATVGGAR